MSLFEKIKSLLGMGDSESSGERRDVGVTVEREAGDREVATESERAVKGTGPSDGDTVTETVTESSGAESGTGDDPESRVPSEAVDVIKGIGPTYAGRLSDAGVETVEDLAAADAGDLADRADVPQARLEDWIERAKARTR